MSCFKHPYKEKRYALRFEMNTEAVIFLEGKEIICTVKDISSSGIAFIIKNKDLPFFNINDVFSFQTVESTDPKLKIFAGKCKIIRINSDNNDSILLGCVLYKNSDISKYVDNKEIQYFLKIIKEYEN